MAQKNIKRSVSMSEEMHTLLMQIATKRGRDITEAHLIREAIRQFLDEQTAIVGSRRHFQKSLQARLDHLEDTLTFQLHILVFLLMAILADETVLDDAIRSAGRDGERLLKRIQAVRAQQEDI
ncbi:MAG: hypothetical protein J0M07_18760 [Anaerolineae bacterium]|jgi:uncharacterized coiled-coil protein SlyX|nr:hypothetical protein [Anaerolineae bacterium]